jgi:molybdate transport system substrate-binding protein
MTNGFRAVFLTAALTCITSISCRTSAGPREIHVAAAANLRNALEDAAGAFQSKTSIRVVPTFGATAQLTQQIENGAPIDVFLSADSQHVDQLISKSYADPQSRAIYARGALVLWAPSRPDVVSLHDLTSPRVLQIGCARPELAPYGAAAIQALKKEGIWTAVESKIVYGQSISAAKQFADSGNVAASFTALSLVVTTGGHYVPVDPQLYDPIDQTLCIVKQTSQPEAAREFRDFVLSPSGREIFGRYGYTLP